MSVKLTQEMVRLNDEWYNVEFWVVSFDSRSAAICLVAGRGDYDNANAINETASSSCGYANSSVGWNETSLTTCVMLAHRSRTCRLNTLGGRKQEGVGRPTSPPASRTRSTTSPRSAGPSSSPRRGP
jgi:hypothetical protein